MYYVNCFICVSSQILKKRLSVFIRFNIDDDDVGDYYRRKVENKVFKCVERDTYSWLYIEGLCFDLHVQYLY